MTSNHEQGSAADGSQSPAKNELQHNALGLLTAAAMTAAYMGPALSMYALFGLMSARVGQGIGFVMLIVMGMTLLSAISFGMLAKEVPSAGGVYAWARKALGKPVGAWVGLSAALYFAVSNLVPPIVFGQFFLSFLKQLNVPIDSWGVNGETYILAFGATAMMAVSSWIAYRGIVVSSHMAFTLLLIELAVVVALTISLLIYAIGQGTASFEPLTLGACKNGWRGVIYTIPFALMCMVCDAAVPTAEETRNAKWTIPLAVVLTCFLVGVWYIFGFSVWSMAYTPDPDASNAESAVAPMAELVWGNWKILVSITAMTAALGAQIPILTASSRIMFAMARDNTLPAIFARLHPQLHAPWNSLHLVCAFTFLGVVPPILIFGAQKTVDVWGNLLGWFIAVVYFTANLVNIVYYWRFARERFHWVLNFLIPGCAMVVQLWFVWAFIIKELGDQGTIGQVSQIAIGVTAVLTTLYVTFLFVRRKAA
jgi:amino acid transporter